MRCLTANHGNEALLLGIVENLVGPWPLLVVEGGLQTITVVAMGDLADRLGRKRDCLRDARRRDAIGKLPQYKSAEDDTHLLNATSQQFHNLS